MNEQKNIKISCGGGTCTTLTIVFVVLKLVGVIDWSWIWVLSPIWIGAGLSLIFLTLFFIVGFISAFFKK